MTLINLNNNLNFRVLNILKWQKNGRGESSELESESSELWCRVIQGLYGTVNLRQNIKTLTLVFGKQFVRVWIRWLRLVFGALETEQY